MLPVHYLMCDLFKYDSRGMWYVCFYVHKCFMDVFKYDDVYYRRQDLLT